MPELPEVEVIRLFLQSHLVGKTISNLEIITPKSFIAHPEPAEGVEGQKIINTSRIGKQLSLHLKNGLILLFHFKMTGQVIFVPLTSKGSAKGVSLGHPTPLHSFNQGWPNKSTRLIFTFLDKSKLYFNDQRKFGWVKVLNQSELAEAQKNLGLDILSPKFTSQYFYHQLQFSSRPIKSVLLDQSKFAGVGNIYANDVLFLSHLHPNTPSNKISLPKARILRKKLINLLKESISQGGSTAKDNKYIHPDGSPGQHQFSFRVYQQDGKPCLVCKTPIKRIKIGSRGTFYCPQCQKPLLK